MAKEVDLRSDTVTKPTAGMRRAMAEAVVGDDVYGEDPTVNALEEIAAKMLGKEAAVFVASGTMGNLSSVMAHCWTRGQEIIVGDQTHIFMYEQGGVSQLANVHVSAVSVQDDGTFNLEQLRERLRSKDPSMHEPETGLICLENTNNRCGGRVLPIAYIKQVCAIAREHGIPVHMDGARIINASVYSGIPVDEIVRECASVSMCLSKGVGAPVGSVVAGSKEFIARVRRCRKVLGGSMRQAGVLAAAAIVALDTAHDRMKLDYQRAKKFASDIANMKSKIISADPCVVQSNMVLLNFPSSDFTSQDFVEKMAKVEGNSKDDVITKTMTWFRNRVRLVFHSDVSQEDLDKVLSKIRRLSNGAQ